MQLVEVTGENAHARRVSETVLYGWVVQPAENLQVIKVIGQLVQQGRRFPECAVRLRDQIGLIKAEVIHDREQAARRICLANLPQTLHTGEEQGYPSSFEERASFNDSASYDLISIYHGYENHPSVAKPSN